MQIEIHTVSTVPEIHSQGTHSSGGVRVWSVCSITVALWHRVLCNCKGIRAHTSVVGFRCGGSKSSNAFWLVLI